VTLGRDLVAKAVDKINQLKNINLNLRRSQATAMERRIKRAGTLWAAKIILK